VQRLAWESMTIMGLKNRSSSGSVRWEANERERCGRDLVEWGEISRSTHRRQTPRIVKRHHNNQNHGPRPCSFAFALWIVFLCSVPNPCASYEYPIHIHSLSLSYTSLGERYSTLPVSSCMTSKAPRKLKLSAIYRSSVLLLHQRFPLSTCSV
jgi:hypothetical protein